ncbi:MAG: hypothetical protein KJ646_05675 [Nanoarchaeota archaeon]|nr:hypothetical protein [Nanoarchaeota archaeon]
MNLKELNKLISKKYLVDKKIKNYEKMGIIRNKFNREILKFKNGEILIK